MELFRSADLNKDLNRFWALLREWYRDPHSREWYAPWSGFHFVGAFFTDAVFVGNADFTDTVFVGDADVSDVAFGPTAEFGPAAEFGNATFTGPVDFSEARFGGYAQFHGACFCSQARFSGTSFKHNADFWEARFKDDCRFGACQFEGDVFFWETIFNADVTFMDAVFRKSVHFSESHSAGRMLLYRTAICSTLELDVTLTGEGTLVLSHLGAEPPSSDDWRPRGAPRVKFGSMSLRGVELHHLDPSALRFPDAVDVDKVSLSDVAWPRWGKGYRLGDHDDLESAAVSAPEGPSARELERLYAALRKNSELRNDRIDRNRWYWSEMDVGRRLGDRRFTRILRGIYRGTSDYGLSAGRAGLWLLAATLLALLAFMIPWTELCPIVDGKCGGWAPAMNVILRSIFLLPSIDGVELEGIPAQLLGLVMRVVGIGMLLSMWVAGRNQLAH